MIQEHDMSASKTASYKGRTYKLLFVGDTKFGKRAKLGFMDGSKEFWVSADAVQEVAGVYTGTRRSERGGCAACGRGGPLVRDLEDGLLKHRSCCDMEP